MVHALATHTRPSIPNPAHRSKPAAAPRTRAGTRSSRWPSKGRQAGARRTRALRRACAAARSCRAAAARRRRGASAGWRWCGGRAGSGRVPSRSRRPRGSRAAPSRARRRRRRRSTAAPARGACRASCQQERDEAGTDGDDEEDGTKTDVESVETRLNYSHTSRLDEGERFTVCSVRYLTKLLALL